VQQDLVLPASSSAADRLASTLSVVSELSEAELDALVAQATVDCYNEDEELAGFAVVIEDNLALPFETTVLRITVTVRKTVQTESGIVAICVRGKHRQAIPILDLPLPDPPPRGAEWIAVLGLTALGNMFIELYADCTGAPRRLRHPGRRGSGVRRPAQLTDLVMWAACPPGEDGLRGGKWDRVGGPWRGERS
jgi:hypothetical protein